MTTPDNSNHRRSIRLPGYDYSQTGAYFVTIVTHDRKVHFGEIVKGEMVLNELGRMVETVWLEIPNHFKGVNVDTFVVMPNHIHGIIEVDRKGSPATGGPNAYQTNPIDLELPQGVDLSSKEATLSQIVNHFKSFTTHHYIIGVRQHGWEPFDRHFWQRNYYEHIIRSERDYQSIYGYIQSNPLNWLQDEEFIK